MRVSEETLHTLIWNFKEVNVSSHGVESDYYIKYIGSQQYQVTYWVKGKNNITKVFNSFRNGDEESPDMENYLPYWVETLNASDCDISISDSRTCT